MGGPEAAWGGGAAMTGHTQHLHVAAAHLGLMAAHEGMAPKALRRALAPHLCKRPAGAVLSLEGEGSAAIYSLLSGWITVSKSLENGHRQIVDVLLAGETISTARGGLSVAAVQIEALTETVALIVPDEVFSRLVPAHPGLRERLDRTTAAIVARMSERMLRLGRGSAEGRIAYAICEFCLRVAPGGLRDGVSFPLPMNQQQFGDFTGLSAVHVCRVLRRFREEGLVSMTERMEVVIADADRLAALAEIDPVQLQERVKGGD